MGIREGIELLSRLPEGYGVGTKITYQSDRILIAHPELPPLIVWRDGKVEEVRT